MKKMILSLILVLAMLLGCMPGLNIQNHGWAEEVDSQLATAIEDMKEYYAQEVDQYDYLEATILRSLGVNKDVIKGKLELDELSFNIGNSYMDSSSKEYAKAIIGLIAAGVDATNYQGKDYLNFLVDSQNEEGFFVTKIDSGDKAEDIAYSIIALDMSGADYDVYKAVKLLENRFTIEGDKAFVKEWSFYSDGDLELTSISLIALSNHQDIVNKELIVKVINYLDSERFSSGMYGEIDWGQEKESAKLTSKVIQALIAVKEEISNNTIEGLLSLKNGNQFKESNSSYGDYATAEVFAALTDIYLGKSMFKEVAIEIGDPATVDIVLPAGFTELKIGKQIQLLAKVYDVNGKYNSSQSYIWSSDNTDIATVDEKGIVTGIDIGTANITVKVSGFENVEKSIVINVVGIEPDTIDINIDGELSEIEVGKKIKISANVLDAGGEKVEQIHVQWTLSSDDLAQIDDEGIFTALGSGTVTITASVDKNGDEILWDSVDLKIVSRQERIDNALEEVKEGIIVSGDKYEYTTAMGLKLIGVDEDYIAEKATRYSQYFANNNSRAKDIMMAIAIGQDPEDYHGKNYIQDLLVNNFYEDTNPEWLINTILALDMAGADYDEQKAIDALLNKMTNSSGRHYIKNTNNNPNNELTALSLIVFSKHKDLEGVQAAIKGIKNHLESIQNENALIVNCEAHSFAIQGLIASGEDIYSDRWTKEDGYGNKTTLLDALLNLKVGSQFKVLPGNNWPASGQEVFGFAALVDLSLNKSMYYQLENLGTRDFTIKIQGESKELRIDQGETVELKVEVFENDELVDREVIWESLDDTIVEVQNGIIRGLKEGETKVRVKLKSFEDIYDELTVKVAEVIGVPESVIIKQLNDGPITKGDQSKLEAIVLDGFGNTLEAIEIEWTSSNEEVLSIDVNGNTTAYKAGTVKITVRVKDTDIKNSITVTVFENQEEANNTLDKFIGAIKEYYETLYYRESQGQLDAWESVTLTRAGMDLDRWYTNEDYAPTYDMNLQYLGNKANQALIMLDLDRDPTSYKGRNLIEEIVEEIGNEDYGHGNQSYLKAVIAVDRYNEKYQEQRIDYDESIVISNILLAQTMEGGFKERGNDPVPLNTGYALNALSMHREYAGVEESINKAIEYLQAVQKDDGAFYTSTFVTANNAEIISGLLSVGEDLTSEKWTKGDKNPIESMFILWKGNGSFGNMEGESENNRPWTTATQKSLYTMVDLKEAGYSDYIIRSKALSDIPEELEETLDVYTAIVVDSGDSYEMKSGPKEVIINTKLHNKGLTALGSLQATTPLYEMTGSMVTSIYGIENKGTGGWIYAVNDKMPDTTADKVILKDGDKVVWFYSTKGMDGEIPTWAELTGEKEPEEEKDFKIESLGKEEIINGKQAELKYKIINLTDKSRKVIFTVGLYDKKTDKLINYSSIDKEFHPEEEITMEAIFFIPLNSEYYIEKIITNR